jgi:hypothetical protein
MQEAPPPAPTKPDEDFADFDGDGFS